ncbi:MAG: hypothetical protein J6A69_00520 [Clostridia bacterium]|nr:hypothetical protein [Clostridia bacterium]MBO5452438.1 hypothetical protein [Clostridia bacterium]MBQ8765588.1 hypothetical protein [Clostridia bacterium]
MYFEEFELGSKTQIEPAVINKDDMIDFAKKYDNIPLHTDEEYAKSTIFGKLIAPGVMSFMSVWAKYLENDLAGDELLAGKSTKIEWFSPSLQMMFLQAPALYRSLQNAMRKTALSNLPLKYLIRTTNWC